MRECVVYNGGGSASLGTNGARFLSDFELRISVFAVVRKVGGIRVAVSAQIATVRSKAKRTVQYKKLTELE